MTRRRKAPRRRSSLGAAFSTAAKECKGRPLSAFRACMSTKLKK